MALIGERYVGDEDVVQSSCTVYRPHGCILRFIIYGSSHTYALT